MHTNKIQFSNSLLIQITGLRGVTLQLVINPSSAANIKSVLAYIP
jgi:hypothetical protein